MSQWVLLDILEDGFHLMGSFPDIPHDLCIT